MVGRFFGILLVVLAGVAPWGSRADEGSVSDDIENNPVCRSIGYFIVGAASTHLGRGAHSAVVAGAAMAGVGLGSDSIQARCERSLEDYADYYRENPVDYDDFVRNYCGGNPFNCPGGFSAQPSSCGYFMVCAPYTVESRQGLSISDIQSGIYTIDLANSINSWVLTPPRGGGDWDPH